MSNDLDLMGATPVELRRPYLALRPYFPPHIRPLRLAQSHESINGDKWWPLVTVTMGLKCNLLAISSLHIEIAAGGRMLIPVQLH
jgi:hypothetical protein